MLEETTGLFCAALCSVGTKHCLVLTASVIVSVNVSVVTEAANPFFNYTYIVNFSSVVLS